MINWSLQATLRGQSQVCRSWLYTKPPETIGDKQDQLDFFIQTCTRLQQRSAKDAHIVEAGEARIHNEWMMFNVIDVFVYLGRTCIVGLEFVFASSVWMWLCSREEVRLGILGWRPTMGPTEHLLTSLIVTSPFSTGIVKSQIFGESSARPLTRGAVCYKNCFGQNFELNTNTIWSKIQRLTL